MHTYAEVYKFLNNFLSSVIELNKTAKVRIT